MHHPNTGTDVLVGRRAVPQHRSDDAPPRAFIHAAGRLLADFVGHVGGYGLAPMHDATTPQSWHEQGGYGPPQGQLGPPQGGGAMDLRSSRTGGIRPAAGGGLAHPEKKEAWAGAAKLSPLVL